MTFIVAPSTSFDGVNLTTLAGASVHQAKRFDLDPGTYRLISARSPSPVFTTSGSNAVLGGPVSGSDPTFLIAPEASFSGDQLISLTGALISRSTNVTGLLGTVSYRAIVLSPASDTFDISLSWIVVGTVITQAPTPTSPTVPVIVDGVVTGPAGRYRFTNSTASTVSELDAIPPISVFDFGVPGDSITAEYWTFSLEGPDITLPVTPQIEVAAVGTLSRSVATITLTPATWDTGGVTVVRQKVINDVSSSLTGTTFDVNPGDDFYVIETASKTGFITSDPAQTATGNRPLASPVLVGSKSVGFAGTLSNAVISLTDLTGGIDTAPQSGDMVVIAYCVGSGSGTPALSFVTSGYTTLASLFSDDTADTSLVAGYKFMTGTPDTSVTVSDTDNTASAGAVAVMVFRGVDPSTPLDVATTTSTGINGGRPTPPAITPTTPGAIIGMFGGSGNQAPAVFVSGLSNFITRTQGDTNSITVGAGTYSWISGTYTPVQWTGNTTSTQASWASATFALRPAP